MKIKANIHNCKCFLFSEKYYNVRYVITTDEIFLSPLCGDLHAFMDPNF